MRLVKLHAGVVALSGLLLAAGAALASDQTEGAGRQQQLKPNPIEAMRRFEPPAEEPYTLGAGDELTIEVLGRPEVSGRHVVGPDGRITLPISGPFEAAGLTREAAAQGITSALGRYYARSSVTVRVDKYASNRILVLGRVTKPGVIYFDRTPTLLEALTQSGGLSVPGGGIEKTTGTGNLVTSVADSIPSRCAIFRGKDEVLWVELRRALDNGSLAADMRLRRNDTIYVPAEQDQYVSILGEVQHPGAYKLTPEVTLVELFAMAGGATEMAAAGKMRLIRPSTGMEREVSLDEILTRKKGFDVGLQNGDVLYVPRSGFAKFGYVLQKLSPLSTLLFFTGVGH